MQNIQGFKDCLGEGTYLSCIGEAKTSDFYKSWSEYSKDGFTPFCKKCCEQMFQHYYDITKDYKSACYYVCAKNDLPFISEVWEESSKDSFKAYYSALNKHKAELGGIWHDLYNSDTFIDEVDTRLQDKAEYKKELTRLRRAWGEQDCEDDYNYLEDVYTRYTMYIDEMQAQQEDIYRDLCKDRLRLKKLRQSNADDSVIDKVQDRIQKTMKLLKIDNFDSNSKKTLSEQSFIEKIRMIEETRPCEHYEQPDLYKDFNHRKFYQQKFTLRPLANMLAGHKDFNLTLEDIEKYKDNNPLEEEK